MRLDTLVSEATEFPQLDRMSHSKQVLRSTSRAQLKTISPAQRQAAGRAIAAWLSTWEKWTRPTTGAIALFNPLIDEPDIRWLVQAHPNTRWWLPTYQLGDANTQPGPGWKPSDPADCHHSLSIIQLVLIPGLAFDRRGGRLGRGGGWYDRALATLSPTAIRVGICYTSQLINEVPTEPHDIRMHHLITETGIVTPLPELHW
ncbi:MAG: 5-formyltetrahydrofolate cyclo-ligase [Verrucomicrobiales bacterium]